MCTDVLYIFISHNMNVPWIKISWYVEMCVGWNNKYFFIMAGMNISTYERPTKRWLYNIINQSACMM